MAKRPKSAGITNDDQASELNLNTSLSESDLTTLHRLEKELWIAATRYDPTYMNVVFAPDFFEFGRSGRVWSRQELLLKEGRAIVAVHPLPNFVARSLTWDVAQVTYESHVTYDGTVEYARRSSIWSRADTAVGWRLRFHQGTPFQPT
jgi:hypothetical protein